MTDVNVSADHKFAWLNHDDFSEVTHSVFYLFSLSSFFFKDEELNVDSR